MKRPRPALLSGATGCGGEYVCGYGLESLKQQPYSAVRTNKSVCTRERWLVARATGVSAEKKGLIEEGEGPDWLEGVFSLNVVSKATRR